MSNMGAGLTHCDLLDDDSDDDNELGDDSSEKQLPSTQTQLYTCKLLEGGEDKEMAMTIEEMTARTATTI